mgnify:CR=1 FL=1
MSREIKFGAWLKEAKEIINDEEKLKEKHEDWLWETIETGFRVLEIEDKVEDWKRMDQWLNMPKFTKSKSKMK